MAYETRKEDYKEKRFDERYDLMERELEELAKGIKTKQETEIINRVLTEELHVPRLQALPRMSEEPIKPLKRSTPEIFGTLFDKIDFLRERITETKGMLDARKQLHADVIAEVDRDIAEKSEIESRLADINEKRNFKLDISILRKEKRAESLQFWRDVLELRTELREILEQYSMERKISNIFSELRGGTDGDGNSGKADF